MTERNSGSCKHFWWERKSLDYLPKKKCNDEINENVHFIFLLIMFVALYK